MTDPTTRVPVPLDDDPEDVVEALEVAGALWEKGDRADAIRWVRRAAEAAADAGDTSRLAALARSAADLEQVAAPSPSAPSLEDALVPADDLDSQTRPAVRSVAPPARPTAPPPLPSRAPRPPTPAAPTSDRALPPSDPALPTLEELRAPRPVTVPPSDPALPRSVAPRPMTLPPSDRVSVAPRPMTVPPSDRHSVTPRPMPVAPESSPPSSVLPANARVPEASARGGPARLRVSVRTSVRDAGLLVVRPLADGQAPPPGTREAFLVMADDGAVADEVARSNGSLG
jgi:hypothetical protein